MAQDKAINGGPGPVAEEGKNLGVAKLITLISKIIFQYIGLYTY